MKKTIAKFVSGMLISIFEILVGILLLIDPIAFTSGIIMAFGAVLMFASIICFFKYFRTEAAAAVPEQMLFKGLLALAAGAFFVFGNNYFISLFSLLYAIYGIAILAVGLLKIQKTVDMLRLNKMKWVYSAISAVITVACAVFILVNPFETAEGIWRFIGISLIVEAVIDAVSFMFGEKEEPASDEAEESEESEEK